MGGGRILWLNQLWLINEDRKRTNHHWPFSCCSKIDQNHHSLNIAANGHQETLVKITISIKSRVGWKVHYHNISWYIHYIFLKILALAKSLYWMVEALATNRWMTKITFPPSFDHTSNSSNRALVCKQRIWLNIVKQNMIAYLLHILNTNSYPKLEVSVWDNISRTHCEDNANFLKLLLLKDEHLPLLNVQAASLPNIFTDFLRPSICHHLPSMLAVLQSEKPQNR